MPAVRNLYSTVDVANNAFLRRCNIILSYIKRFYYWDIGRKWKCSWLSPNDNTTYSSPLVYYFYLLLAAEIEALTKLPKHRQLYKHHYLILLNIDGILYNIIAFNLYYEKYIHVRHSISKKKTSSALLPCNVMSVIQNLGTPTIYVEY